MYKTTPSDEIVDNIEKLCREIDALEEELLHTKNERDSALYGICGHVSTPLKEFGLIWLMIFGAIHAILDVIGVVYRAFW